MALQKLQIPPGIYRNGTEYQAMGRWFDANLVRWGDGSMKPVGGWQGWTTTVLTGKARGVHDWLDNSNDRHLAVGTASKLYAINEAATVTDITPVGLTAGSEDSAAPAGYGAALYGEETYGTPRSGTGTPTDADTWSLDNWGENLVACLTSDGKLYEWPLTGVAAEIVGAPVNCQGLIVTEERFLVALGADGNKRLIKWSDQEDNTNWTPDATNQAGEKELVTNGQVMGAVRVRGQTLYLTDTDAHAAAYIGPPLVFGFQKVGDACGLASPHALVGMANGTAIWMGYGGSFFIYDGAAVSGLPSDVSDFLRRDVNWSQKAKIYAVNNGRFGEIWWFYQSNDGTDCDSYVVFSSREGHWTIGQMTRCGGVDAGVFDLPIYVGVDGLVYKHEVDFAYGGAVPFAESGPVEIGTGTSLMWVTSVVPDELTLGDVQIGFKTRMYPTEVERLYGPYNPEAPTDIRFTARQIRLVVTGARPTHWRVGTLRLEAQEAGLR